MGLREQINDSLKEAMKAKDQKRVGTLRLINAALKDKDIAARTETSRELLGDDEILSLLAKMIKQREDSIVAYKAGNRPELAAAEEAARLTESEPAVARIWFARRPFGDGFDAPPRYRVA